jgi:hypothetical protein
MSQTETAFDALADSAGSRANAYREISARRTETPIAPGDDPVIPSRRRGEGVVLLFAVAAPIAGIALLMYEVLSNIQARAALLPVAHEPTNYLVGIGALLLKGLLFSR